MSGSHEELEALLLEWESGTLDADGILRVREMLKTDDEARRIYVNWQTLSSALKLENESGLSAPLTRSASVHGEVELADTTLSDKRTARPSPAIGKLWWFAAAAAAIISIQAARLFYLEFIVDDASRRQVAQNVAPDERNESDEAMSSGVAIIKSLVDVQWRVDGDTHEVGDALEPGRLSIQEGLAQIEFFCGATVIIEGPAELDLESPMLARVHQGRLRAQVPPAARGFSIDVADMKVVDLGTEFGISVSPKGTDVQVFDGEVELHRPAAEKRTLTTGQAVSRSSQGQFQDTDASPNQFVDIATLESRERDQENARFARWHSWSTKRRSDPRLIAYYTFDQPGGWQRKLQSSVEPKNENLDGAIVGANRVKGRWEQKHALEFKKPGDRVRVQIPGEYSSLTFSAWVKIDSLDRWYNSLFLTDHYNQGEPHWQILDTGQLFFSVRHKADNLTGPLAKKQTHQAVLSAPFWNPSMSGRWLHLATVYDAPAGRTTHYLNGDLLHEESISPDLRVETTRIGAASIGNWSIPTKQDSEFAVRNLNGSIDEFTIFAAALSADEINEMYQNGRP